MQSDNIKSKLFAASERIILDCLEISIVLSGENSLAAKQARQNLINLRNQATQQQEQLMHEQSDRTETE
ncbi:MAG: hypothetical protein AAGF01_01415 [Cyanobacteria bacterium P01_G01_bin.38]